MTIMRLHQKAVPRYAVCRFRRSICHLSKNTRLTTRVAPVLREIRVSRQNPYEPHDVGSEYAVYMVGPAQKIGFSWGCAGAAARRLKFLTG
jgi:hypothetical protein